MISGNNESQIYNNAVQRGLEFNQNMDQKILDQQHFQNRSLDYSAPYKFQQEDRLKMMKDPYYEPAYKNLDGIKVHDFAKESLNSMLNKAKDPTNYYNPPKKMKISVDL